MANSNGSKMYLWVFSAIVFPVLFFIGNSVIANDKDSRLRDTKIEEKQVVVREEQQKTNQEILLALKDIQWDIKIIKKEIENGNRRGTDQNSGV